MNAMRKVKTPETLARQIESGMHHAKNDPLLYEDEHSTVYEKDLAYICPRKDKDRRKKLVEFAAQHGFGLRFYREGLFAIFGLRTPAVAAAMFAFASIALSPTAPAVNLPPKGGYLGNNTAEGYNDRVGVRSESPLAGLSPQVAGVDATSVRLQFVPQSGAADYEVKRNGIVAGRG